MKFEYKIELVEYHVIISKYSFYVWYEDHYIHDFKKLSDRHVFDLIKNVKRKLVPFYKITSMYDGKELLGYGYSQRSLRRQMKRCFRMIDRCISMKRVL